MFPFDQLRRRTKNRRFSVALAVIAGAYEYGRLSAQLRARIDAKIREFLDGGGASTQEFRRFGGWSGRGFGCAWAMANLGISPSLGGYVWPEFLLGSWRTAVFHMVDFNKFDEATNQAIRHLRSLGAEIPESLPLDPSWAEALADAIAKRPLPNYSGWPHSDA